MRAVRMIRERKKKRGKTSSKSLHVSRDAHKFKTRAYIIHNCYVENAKFVRCLAEVQLIPLLTNVIINARRLSKV